MGTPLFTPISKPTHTTSTRSLLARDMTPFRLRLEPHTGITVRREWLGYVSEARIGGAREARTASSDTGSSSERERRDEPRGRRPLAPPATAGPGSPRRHPK